MSKYFWGIIIGIIVVAGCQTQPKGKNAIFPLLVLRRSLALIQRTTR